MSYETPVTDAERREWEADFEAAARRPLSTRLRYAFIKTYKPVLDDAKSRSFETMEEYRQWCEQHLPSWLGYGRGEISAELPAETQRRANDGTVQTGHDSPQKV